MGELIEEGVDLLAQLRPVVSEAMSVEHVAAQPVPQLLDRIEPGRRGRQPDGLQARELAQRRQHVGMVVDGPVVLHEVDAPGVWRDLIEAPVEGADLLAADQRVVEVLHLAGERIERADKALRAVGRPRFVHLARTRPRRDPLPIRETAGQRSSPISSKTSRTTSCGPRTASRRQRSR